MISIVAVITTLLNCDVSPSRVDGETCGEKKVKRPKHSCAELHQEAKEYHVSSSVKDEVNIP